jgi:hypothetical protein
MEMSLNQLEKSCGVSHSSISWFFRKKGFLPIGTRKGAGKTGNHEYVYGEDACKAAIEFYSENKEKESSKNESPKPSAQNNTDVVSALLLILESMEKQNSLMDRIATALEKLPQEFDEDVSAN